MNSKITAFVTIFAFTLFTVSCVRYSPEKTVPEQAAAQSQQGEQVDILGVVKKSGERIDYPEKDPGRIVGDRIVATGIPPDKNVPMELDKKDIQETRKDSRNRVIGLKTWNGTRYWVVEDSYEEFDNKVKFLAIVEDRLPDIPLDEVELVWVRKVDAGMTFLATAGGVVLSVAAIGIIGMLLKESCPFVYSFDGERYVFDAEPYGGAICEGMQRTEWCGLEYLEEADGLYQMLVTNEVNETQYTDEMRLVVVDHPRGTQVVADEEGVLHTISRPMAPVAAHDEEGRSLLFYVGENDWVFWKTDMDEKGLVERAPASGRSSKREAFTCSGRSEASPVKRIWPAGSICCAKSSCRIRRVRGSSWERLCIFWESPLLPDTAQEPGHTIMWTNRPILQATSLWRLSVRWRRGGLGRSIGAWASVWARPTSIWHFTALLVPARNTDRI